MTASHNARENLAVKLTRAEIDTGERRAADLLSFIPAEKLIYGQTLTASEQVEKDRQDTVRDYVVAGAVVGGVGGGLMAGTVATAATTDYGPGHPAQIRKGALDQTSPSASPVQKTSSVAAPATTPAPVNQSAAPTFQPVANAPASSW